MTKNSKFTNNSYEPLRSIMSKFGASCSPEVFYWAVNIAYHAAESVSYDEIHRDMYEEEEKVWNRLLCELPEQPQTMIILDVGCGTGLVGQFISQMHPQRVAKMHLLDPSDSMLKAASEKAKKWQFGTSQYHGDIFCIPKTNRYHVITINSVLHHVVDLPPFLNKIEELLVPGGILLLAHDPRAGAESDAVLCKRKSLVANRFRNRVSFYRKMRSRIAPIIKEMLGVQRQSDLEIATNKPLLEKGIVKKPMDSKSIWAVTDFHVPNQPGNFGKGIDLSIIARYMPSVKLVANFTYHYHDNPWTILTEEERKNEQQWWFSGDMHGAETASVWRKS